MSDPKWFYTRGEKRFGPVDSAKLKTLAADGKLAADDLIWKEEMPDWVPASQLRGLFPASDQTGDATVEPTVAAVAASLPIEGAGPPPALGAAMPEVGPVEPGGRWRERLTGRSLAGNPLAQIVGFGQLFVLVGLVLVIAAKGCDEVGQHYITSSQATYLLAKNKLREEDNEDLHQLTKQNNRLEEKGLKQALSDDEEEQQQSNREKMREISQKQEHQIEENDLRKWERIRIRAKDAPARYYWWAFWFESVFTLGTLILATGLLITGFSSKGPVRWMCLVLLAIVTFSIFIGGMSISTYETPPSTSQLGEPAASSTELLT